MGILFCHLRIIYPACAGVNLAVVRCQKVYFYFPRVRGGQPDFVIDAYATFGFSPHARGSPFRASGSTSQSIHPACAGVNPITRGTGFGVENTPRMRGGNLAVARCQKVYFYFPRMRGGQPFARVALRASLFTPHARGSTLFIDWPFDGVSIHPACAGVNPPTDRLLCSYAHSPRMRGDQPR